MLMGVRAFRVIALVMLTSLGMAALVPCSVPVPFTRWRNVNGVNCPPTLSTKTCQTNADCTSVDTRCSFGTTAPLSCLTSPPMINGGGGNVCGFVSSAFPTLTNEGGFCMAPTYSCALCTASPCQGVALCVNASTCPPAKSRLSLHCFVNGTRS